MSRDLERRNEKKDAQIAHAAQVSCLLSDVVLGRAVKAQRKLTYQRRRRQYKISAEELFYCQITTDKKALGNTPCVYSLSAVENRRDRQLRTRGWARGNRRRYLRRHLCIS